MQSSGKKHKVIVPQITGTELETPHTTKPFDSRVLVGIATVAWQSLRSLGMHSNTRTPTKTHPFWRGQIVVLTRVCASKIIIVLLHKGTRSIAFCFTHMFATKDDAESNTCHRSAILFRQTRSLSCSIHSAAIIAMRWFLKRIKRMYGWSDHESGIERSIENSTDFSGGTCVRHGLSWGFSRSSVGTCCLSKYSSMTSGNIPDGPFKG